MKYFFRMLMLFVFSILMSVFILHCNNPADESNGNQDENNDVYDVDLYGIPKFVNINYIELYKIYCISKFRSAIGHDYSDDFESCRSMKHYFHP